MLLLCEIEIAKKINHPFFSGDDVSETAKKKRVRNLARRANVAPVVKKHDIWLFNHEDVEILIGCRSSLENEKDHHTGKSRARTSVSAFEKARKLTTVK